MTNEEIQKKALALVLELRILPSSVILVEPVLRSLVAQAYEECAEKIEYQIEMATENRAPFGETDGLGIALQVVRALKDSLVTQFVS